MIDNKLKEYIEQNILPSYEKNEKGHGIEHINFVIERTFEIIKERKLNINNNMAYVIACYHDIGHYLDKDNHETERIYNHGKAKYGEEGYVLLKFTDSKYENYLKEFQQLILDKTLFQKKLEEVIKDEVIYKNFK